MFNRILGYHQMLFDAVRMTAYQTAIQTVVRPDDVVVDIGTGSGVLAFFALQAGAGRVYAIERQPVIKAAARLAELNGFADRITFIRGISQNVELPEQADVVISEILGSFGIEENVCRFVPDIRERFLKPGGVLLPAWLELYLVPVEAPDVWGDELQRWSHLHGLDFSAVGQEKHMTPHVADCSSARLLAEPARLVRYDFEQVTGAPEWYDFQATCTAAHAGTMHGSVGYFKTGLASDVVLSTAPDAPLTHWKQRFFALAEPVNVEPGDQIACRVKFRLNHLWYWQAAVHRNGATIANARHMKTFITPTEARRQWNRLASVPALSDEGRLHQRVFALCDGQRTVEAIAETIRAEFPDQFENTAVASEKIAAILRGKTQV